MRQGFQLGRKIVAHLLSIAGQVAAEQLVDFSQSRSGADRMAAEGGAVRTGGEGLGNFGRSADGADRHAAAQSLGHGNDVGLDAVVHVAHDAAGAAPTGLDFVQQEQHALFVTQLAQAAQEFLGGRMHAAFALNRLDHNRNGVFGAGIAEGFQVVVIGVGKAGGHVAKADLAGVVRLAGCRHGTKGTAVEAHLCGYNVVFMRSVFLDTVLTRHLNHGFVGLGARVLEVDLIHADRGAHLFGQQGLRDGVRIVEGMHDVVHLVLDGGDHLRIAVAGRVDRDARVKIQIRGAVFVVKVHAFGSFRNEVETLIGFDHVFADQIFDILRRAAGVLEFHFLLPPDRLVSKQKDAFPPWEKRLCFVLYIEQDYHNTTGRKCQAVRHHFGTSHKQTIHHAPNFRKISGDLPGNTRVYTEKCGRTSKAANRAPCIPAARAGTQSCTIMCSILNIALIFQKVT